MENVFELIAKFKINNKNYIIILVNKSKVMFLGYENGKLTTEFSQEEYYIFKEIYNSILIDKKSSINIDTKIVNGTVYKIFYDTNTKNYFWEAEKDKDLDNPKDNILLNFKYNHIPEVVFGVEDSKSTPQVISKFYNKFIKIGKVMVSVALAANIALSCLSGTTLATSKANNTDEKQTTISTNENTNPFDIFSFYKTKEESVYDYEEIRQAIESNPYLTNEEKDFLYKFKFVFDENNQYMDLELITERLKSIKIIYNPEVKAIDKYSATIIQGMYSMKENQIDLYGVKQFEGCNVSVLTHELFHALQSQSSSRYTKELSDEFFTREYLRRMTEEDLIVDKKSFKDPTNTFYGYGKGYLTHMFIYYGLAEMMTEDELRNYQFSCDEKIIVNALSRIDKGQNSTVKAYKFLEALDNLREYNKENNIRTPKEDTETEEKECVDILNDFYYQFKGITIEEDLNVIINGIEYSEVIHDSIEKTLVDNIDPSLNAPQYTPMLGKRTVLPKTYLSKKHPYPYIIFYSPKIAEVAINEEICKQYTKNNRQLEQLSKKEEDIEK